MTHAESVVAVGRCGLHGVHRLAEHVDHVRALRGGRSGLIAVCNATRRSPGERRTVAASLELGRDELVFVPAIGRLERIHRDVAPLPGAVAESIAGRVRTAVED